MKSKKLIRVVSSILVFHLGLNFIPSSSRAASLSLLGGAFQRTSEPSRTAASGFSLTNQKWSASYGAGLILGFRNSSRIGFQTGVIYVPFHYSANLTDTILDETSSIDERYATIRIPIDIQLRVNQSLSLLLGGFYDLPLGTAIESDFGLRAGVSITVPISAKWKLAVQPSYQLGLRRFDRESNSDWSVLAGIRFGD